MKERYESLYMKVSEVSNIIHRKTLSDEVPSVDEIAYDEYRKFAFKMIDIVKENPICQKCGQKESESINRWGTILACCRDCLNLELHEFNRACEEQSRLDKEYEGY